MNKFIVIIVILDFSLMNVKFVSKIVFLKEMNLFKLSNVIDNIFLKKVNVNNVDMQYIYKIKIKIIIFNVKIVKLI